MRCIALLLLFATATVSVQAQMACNAQWECQTVSDNFNYVECRSGRCACLTNQGFYPPANPLTAAPSSSNKCGCASPKSVIWSTTTPHCVSLPAAVANDNGKLAEARMRDTLTRLYTALPLGLNAVADPQLLDSLFAPAAKGRIDPVGSFDNRFGLIEYFFALASASATPVQNVDIRSIIADGAQRKAFIRLNIFFSGYGATGLVAYNLTQSGQYTFDSKGLITSCDLIIHNLGAALGSTVPKLFGPLPEQVVNDLTIADICGKLTDPAYKFGGVVPLPPGFTSAQCLHNNNPTKIAAGYYASKEDCLAFMTSIKFGDYGYQRENSVVCRGLHAFLTLSDPDNHCPHAGKFGGGKCVDVNYDDYFLKEY